MRPAFLRRAQALLNSEQTQVFRIGIIGLGSIGLRMSEAFFKHARFDIVSAFDPSAEACARAKASYPDLNFVADASGVHSDPNIDLVYLASPPLTHKEHATQAISNAKAIFCEKPLGVDLASSEALVAQVSSRSAKAAVNLLHAAASNVIALERALATEELGDIQWAELRLQLPQWAVRRYAEAPWLARRAQGGFIREVATHYLFLCQRIMGALELVNSCVCYPDDDDEAAPTFAAAQMRAASVPVSLVGTTSGAGPDLSTMTLWGSNGAFRVRDLYFLDVLRDDEWQSIVHHEMRPELDTYMCQLDELAAMLGGAQHRLPGFAEAYQVQRLIEAIVRGA